MEQFKSISARNLPSYASIKWNVKDKLVPVVALFAVLLSLLLNAYGATWFNYTFGFEILMVNGFLTFLGLILIRRK